MKITQIVTLGIGAHEYVRIWIDGALSGELVVSEGQGPELEALLMRSETERAVLDAARGVELGYASGDTRYPFIADVGLALSRAIHALQVKP